jgi:hypothetical protein
MVYALLLVSQGVVQNLKPYDTAKLVEARARPQMGADGKPVVDLGRQAGDGYGDGSDDRAGAGGVAGSDQDAGDERRRVLQCEQRASV